MLASSSKDSTVKLWMLGNEAPADHNTPALCSLEGHAGTVLGIDWHNSVANLLASVGSDKSLRVWDVEKQVAIHEFAYGVVGGSAGQVASCMRWSKLGDLISVNSKGGDFKIFDPRLKDGKVFHNPKCHVGPKAQQNCWADDTQLITSGFATGTEREYAVWDLRYFEAPLARAPFGSGNSVAHLHFDTEHKLLVAAGHGSMTVSMWQYNSEIEGCMKHMGDYVGAAPTVAFSMLPKSKLDPTKHEVFRAVRCQNDHSISYVSFQLQNKSGEFQAELYPAYASNVSSNTVEEWSAGTDKPANMTQITKEDFDTINSGGSLASKAPEVKFGNVLPLEKRIAELEVELAEVTAERDDLLKQQ